MLIGFINSKHLKGRAKIGMKYTDKKTHSMTVLENNWYSIDVEYVQNLTFQQHAAVHLAVSSLDVPLKQRLQPFAAQTIPTILHVMLRKVIAEMTMSEEMRMKKLAQFPAIDPEQVTRALVQVIDETIDFHEDV